MLRNNMAKTPQTPPAGISRIITLILVDLLGGLQFNTCNKNIK